MATNPLNDNNTNRTRMKLFICSAVFVALILPGMAFGQGDPDATDTINTTCGFAKDINMILNAVSIIVVTIAVVFSGYQIAFAHKRIGDVAPVLIGAVLIGAASQIANMFLKNSTSASGATACPNTSVMSHALDHYAAVTHAANHFTVAAVHLLTQYA